MASSATASMKPPATTVKSSSAMESFAAMKSFTTMESAVSHLRATDESAVNGVPRPVVNAVIDVVIVVSFMMLPTRKMSPIAKASPVSKVLPVTKIVKIMVEMAEESERCEAHKKW